MRRLLVLLVLASCTDHPPDLAADQGPCTHLDVVTCSFDARCQQAYVVADGQSGPQPLRCLLVESAPATVDACTTLDHDQCRARNDCTPYFQQQLIGNSQPLGDPVYESCQIESIGEPVQGG